MTTQIFLASTAFGLATLAAALDAGLIERGERRLLLVTNNTPTPEGCRFVLDGPGGAGLAGRFTAVHAYGEAIEPLHPAGWSPRRGELPLWERYLRRWLDLSGDEDVALFVESIQVDPAQALCRIFADAPVVVYADGLMSYGPTRSALPETVGARLERLLHLDLVVGLKPLLLHEWGTPSAVIPTEAFEAGIRELLPRRPATLDGRTRPRPVMVLGQYLAALGVLDESEELALNADLVLRCAAAGDGPVVFKPHPAAPPSSVHALRRLADELGVQLWVANGPELAETWFAAGRVSAVAGCFSTGLMTARTVFGLPVARLGTELLLERLTPYQNSNRIPVTLIDALLPKLPRTGFPLGQTATPTPGQGGIDGLVSAVGFAMQPGLLAALRPAATTYLEQHPNQRRRYVKQRRLTRLDLPGRLPPQVPRLRGTGAGLRRALSRYRRTVAQRRRLPRPVSERR